MYIYIFTLFCLLPGGSPRLGPHLLTLSSSRKGCIWLYKGHVCLCSYPSFLFSQRAGSLGLLAWADGRAGGGLRFLVHF